MDQDQADKFTQEQRKEFDVLVGRLGAMQEWDVYQFLKQAFETADSKPGDMRYGGQR